MKHDRHIKRMVQCILAFAALSAASVFATATLSEYRPRFWCGELVVYGVFSPPNSKEPQSYIAAFKETRANPPGGSYFPVGIEPIEIRRVAQPETDIDYIEGRSKSFYFRSYIRVKDWQKSYFQDLRPGMPSIPRHECRTLGITVSGFSVGN